MLGLYAILCLYISKPAYFLSIKDNFRTFEYSFFRELFKYGSITRDFT
jgi:hypothetical protein